MKQIKFSYKADLRKAIMPSCGSVLFKCCPHPTVSFFIFVISPSSLSLQGSDSLSVEHKGILCWLFSPPYSVSLSEEPTLKPEDGTRLVEIGPR